MHLALHKISRNKKEIVAWRPQGTKQLTQPVKCFSGIVLDHSITVEAFLDHLKDSAHILT